MIETAFCTCSQFFLRNKQSKTFSEVLVNAAPDGSRAIGFNDTDFLKEFSCYV